MNNISNRVMKRSLVTEEDIALCGLGFMTPVPFCINANEYCKPQWISVSTHLLACLEQLSSFRMDRPCSFPLLLLYRYLSVSSPLRVCFFFFFLNIVCYHFCGLEVPQRMSCCWYLLCVCGCVCLSVSYPLSCRRLWGRLGVGLKWGVHYSAAQRHRTWKHNIVLMVDVDDLALVVCF